MHVRLARTFLAALLCGLAPLVARAQSDEFPPIKLAGIAHIALRVHDLAVSKAFFLSLGYEEAFDLRRDNVPYESFIKINDRQFIELYPVTAKDPDPGFLHLCFEGDDLPAIHDEYALRGLNPTAVRKAGAGNLLFTMAGPMQPLGAGGADVPQNIEYTQYQAGSLHMNDMGKHLGPERVADRLLGVWLAMHDQAGAIEFYTNQLTFKPLPGKQEILHLAGTSGEQVVIAPAQLRSRANIMLDTPNLGRARRRLLREHMNPGKLTDELVVTDPDGNQIIILER